MRLRTVIVGVLATGIVLLFLHHIFSFEITASSIHRLFNSNETEVHKGDGNKYAYYDYERLPLWGSRQSLHENEHLYGQLTFDGYTQSEILRLRTAFKKGVDIFASYVGSPLGLMDIHFKKTEDIAGGSFTGGEKMTREASRAGINPTELLGETSTISFSKSLSIDAMEGILFHEIGHLFLSGKNYYMENSLGGVSNITTFFDEGFSEYASNLIHLFINEPDTHKPVVSIPEAVESYDSYAMQVKDGMMKNWSSYNVFALNVALVPITLSEEYSPGFLSRYLSEVQEPGKDDVDMKFGNNLLSYDFPINELPVHMESAFGAVMFEGYPYGHWLKNQPVMKSNIKINQPYLTVYFAGKDGLGMSSSINPSAYGIQSAVTKSNLGIRESEQMTIPTSNILAMLTGWDGRNIPFKIYEPTDSKDVPYLRYIATTEQVPDGAYQLRVDSDGYTSAVTYVVYDAEADIFSEVPTKKLYLIVLDKEGKISTSHDVTVNDVAVSVESGFYTYTIPWTTKEVIVRVGDTKRTIFLSDWSKRRLALIQL